ncbi:protein phosphatase 1 regulatory subunit 15A isoform X1 [Tachysurus fulvidraco]|uniref:protein phosphatase 1 regulatory subunit 15A isoform X1 n=1 Tax=Tachysurus fulvidraco TaxID=1234273 RepID=UPI001FEE84E6|nr:protein phosphatase 1 regulatory subunit 15A isoform X1 [Tachysurus fulvidraco]
MTRNSEIKMPTNLEKTVNPQIKAMINSDQLAVAEVLQDDHSHCETEWRQEEDLSDDGASEMSPENRELWDSVLNNSDPYSPLCFTCPAEVKAADSVHCNDDELVPSNLQETTTEWSEEEHTDWSDEGASKVRELWDSLLKNSATYRPLCFPCPAEVNASENDRCDDDDNYDDDDELVSSDSQETEPEWSEEEYSDWSDEGYSEMSPENSDLRDSFLNNSDPYSPLCFFCNAEANASDNVHCDDDELVSSDSQETEPEWSEEEDSNWSDEGYSDMFSESRDLWDSFLNNSNPYSPLCFSCPTEVNASDSDQCDDELVPSNNQETEYKWSEEEDSDWSDEGDSEMSPENRELWDSFLNNSDPYSPLCFLCPTEVNASDSDQCDDELVPSNNQETVYKWSEEEDSDWSDEGDSEMSPENRELWDSFLNNSDPYSPLCFLCPTEVNASDSDQCDDELVPSNNQETVYKWSEEEDSDWSDEGDSEMSPENRELWDSFLNNSDPYSPLCFSCPTEVNASDSDQCDDELVSSNNQETESEWSEEEDSDWSDEGGDSEMSPENRELWDSFMNNSDPYSPLCFSCPAGLKIKASEVKQKHTPSSPTAREVEEHNPDQSTKESAKKVCFSEEVTIHTLEAWGFASQAARDGSCWMKMAIDRLHFKRRVEIAGQLISPCLTAQHRARVLGSLRSHSDILEVQ